MTLRLVTFGALELLDDDGNVLAGAASQAKPLLILALAALHPTGISRSRLTRALWPGVPTDRAKATLKQHLYALRRATGDPELITGTPLLRVASGRLRIDALELESAVERGDLRDAALLLHGELLDGVDDQGGVELRTLVGELRQRFAPAVAITNAAQRLTHRFGAGPVAISVSTLGAGRDLDETVRNTIRVWRTLPADPVVAELRIGATLCRIAESLRGAVAAGLPDEAIIAATAPLRGFLEQVEPIRPFIAGDPTTDDERAFIDWALAGECADAVTARRPFETALLASPIALQLRSRARWFNRILRDWIGSRDAVSEPGRILVLGCSWWERHPPLRGSSWPEDVELVLVGGGLDADQLRAALPPGRLEYRDSDDPLLDAAALDDERGFDLVIAADLFDRRDHAELGDALAALRPRFSEHCRLAFDMPSDRSWVEVSRFLLGRSAEGSDLISLAILSNRIGGAAAPEVGRDCDGGRWRVLMADVGAAATEAVEAAGATVA